MNALSQNVLDKLQRDLDAIEKQVRMVGSYTRIDPYIIKHSQAGIDFNFIVYHLESKLWFAHELFDSAMDYVAKNHLLRKNYIVFDLGCNSGFQTVWFALQTPAGHVHSFDPFPWNTAATEAQARLNGLTNVTTHTVGLGNRRRTIEVDSASSQTLNAARPMAGSRITIQVDTPDKYLHLNPSFLKIDIEGAEHELADTALLTHPSIQRGYVEMHPSFIKASGGDPAHFLRALHARGFDIFSANSPPVLHNPHDASHCQDAAAKVDEFNHANDTAYYFVLSSTEKCTTLVQQKEIHAPAAKESAPQSARAAGGGLKTAIKKPLKALRDRFHNDLYAKLLVLEQKIESLSDIQTEPKSPVALGESQTSKPVLYAPQYLPAMQELIKLWAPYQVCDTAQARFGSDNDGGYILLDDFPPDTIVYSFGINTAASFEASMAQKGFACFIHDPAITGLSTASPLFHCFARGLHWRDDPDHALYSLESLLTENGHTNTKNMILKIAVKSGEWEVLSLIPDHVLPLFRQIIVKFRNCTAIDSLMLREHMFRALSLLNKSHFVTHIHADNNDEYLLAGGIPFPGTLEVSYARKADFKAEPRLKCFPTSLDMPNNQLRADYYMPFWAVPINE